MDPLTQASLGAAAAALASRNHSVRRALIVGAVAGAAPDLDVLIGSGTDPLLSLQYHRHFTHALLFVPVVAVLVAGLFKLIAFKRDWPFKQLLLFASLGALSHGLLDACTSYGTLLYLPFSNHRESWDIISIIDPLFTAPLVLLLVIAFLLKRPRPAHLALMLCSLYLTFGYIQRERAQHYAIHLAESRGLRAESVTARPSFANTILWRIVVLAEGSYYVDAVWLMPFREPKLYSGDTVAQSDISKYATPGTVLANDIERFDHFSQSYLYEVPGMDSVLGDLRYAIFPNSIEPLWGIRFDPDQPDQHVEMAYFREASKPAFSRLWAMIRGRTL
ncbi:MAG: metal-dependent hydrolase [Coraliomargarita sp.]